MLPDASSKVQQRTLYLNGKQGKSSVSGVLQRKLVTSKNRQSLNENLFKRASFAAITETTREENKDAADWKIDDLTKSKRQQKGKISVRSDQVLLRYEPNDEYIEIFDPSMRFIAIHKCYYWDTKDRIRKGTLP